MRPALIDSTARTIRLRPPIVQRRMTPGGVNWPSTVLVFAITAIPVTANPIYVDDDAGLRGDGASWDTAYKYLQDALIGASAETEIRVAQGMGWLLEE